MTLQVQKLKKTVMVKKKLTDNIIFNESNLVKFFNYIKERHQIYKKRFIEKQRAPWTNDKILQLYKFTNVFRDLDPGTQYVFEKIIPICKSPEEIIFNLIIYRLYNKIETFEAVGKQEPHIFDKRSFERNLRRLKKSGVPVFTNAFTVSSYHWVNPLDDKIKNTTTLLKWISEEIDDITGRIMRNKDSETTYKTLFHIKGIGKFLAYQMSVDLGYWNTKVFNEDTFVVAGPGCTRGIDNIFQSKGNLNYEECVFYICEIQDELFNKLEIDREKLFSDRKIKKLNAMAIENCFCEISKYLKAYYGKGRPRNRFFPKTSLDEFLYPEITKRAYRHQTDTTQIEANDS